MADEPSTEDCLRILGLVKGATLDECKLAHKDLVEIWHPDRLAHNPRLQSLATTRLKEINEAYACLVRRWDSDRPSQLARAQARPRVLCVDDEPLVLKGLTRLLSMRFDVVTAPNAQAGLDVLMGDDEIAVVLSDLIMPNVDGIAFLRQAMTVSPHTTRILLTGHKEAVSMAVAVDRRFLFKLLEKACGADLIFDTVQQGVDAWRAQRERASGGPPPG